MTEIEVVLPSPSFLILQEHHRIFKTLPPALSSSLYLERASRLTGINI